MESICDLYERKAALVLETGEFFPGIAIWEDFPVTTGVLCFNTALSGYQEAISDPSYAGQILVFTCPHIGNVGVNLEDAEARRPFLQAMITGDIITLPSNHRLQQDLPTWLQHHNIPGIMGVDTRRLVRIIREAGKPIKAALGTYQGTLTPEIMSELQQQAIQARNLEDDYMMQVSTPQSYEWTEPVSSFSPMIGLQDMCNLRVVVMDFGVKTNILRILKTQGCTVHVVPFTASYSEIAALQPQAIVLSNGPGDPRTIDPKILQTIQQCIDARIPMLGICFGYQLLALLSGAHIVKLPCGHHGINHPVKELSTSRILITSQNHEFVVDEKSLPATLTPTHRSLFDGSLEGFSIADLPIIAVQFHPEAAPGPTDAMTIFTDFIEMAKSHA